MSDSTPKIDRFCVRCKSQISEKRVARVSCFCLDECRRQDRIERRRARAAKYCRRCHRELPRKKTAVSSEPVPAVEITACAPGAHLLTKTAREPYPTSGRTSSRVACQSDRSPGGGHWGTMAHETSADERNQYGHTSCNIATT